MFLFLAFTIFRQTPQFISVDSSSLTSAFPISWTLRDNRLQESCVCVSFFSIFASFVFVFASYEVVAHCSNRKVHAYLWFAPCTSKPPKPNQMQTVYSSTPTNYSRTNISFGVHNSNITACHCHVRYHFHKQFHIIYYHLVFPSHCLLYTVRHTTALLIVCYTSTWRNLLHE